MERFYCDNAASGAPSVAVSACLLGHAVRYDGGNKAHALLHEVILPHVNVLAQCPEAGAGLGVPRPAVQLVISEAGLRARGREQYALDVTDALLQFAHSEIQTLRDIPLLCGHIFKSRSPSCGLWSTSVHDLQGHEIATGSGIYAQIISTHLPWLALIEETQLNSRTACQDYLQKLFLVRDIQLAASQRQLTLAHQHYQTLWQQSPCVNDLDKFATENNWQDYLATFLKILP